MRSAHQDILFNVFFHFSLWDFFLKDSKYVTFGQREKVYEPEQKLVRICFYLSKDSSIMEHSRLADSEVIEFHEYEGLYTEKRLCPRNERRLYLAVRFSAS